MQLVTISYDINIVEINDFPLRLLLETSECKICFIFDKTLKWEEVLDRWYEFLEEFTSLEYSEKMEIFNSMNKVLSNFVHYRNLSVEYVARLSLISDLGYAVEEKDDFDCPQLVHITITYNENQCRIKRQYNPDTDEFDSAPRITELKSFEFNMWSLEKAL